MEQKVKMKKHLKDFVLGGKYIETEKVPWWVEKFWSRYEYEDIVTPRM